jgi:tetratricopeptide (TPR) repeat protein
MAGWRPAPAVHRTIVCADVAGYGDPQRTNRDQVALRDGLYGALRTAFLRSGLRWERCHREDRGDGALILVPPETPKELLAGPFPVELATALDEHNAGVGPEARIRLRVAMHAGEMHPDDHGFAGNSINLASRLLDADPPREALKDPRADLALIVSEWFYEEVVRQDPDCRPDTYRQVKVEVKQTRATAWLRLPGPAAPNGRNRPTGTPRLHAREPATTDPGDTDPDTTIRRVLAWYLHTAADARHAMEPQRLRLTETVPLTLPGYAPRTPPFASARDARTWCEAERLTLLAAVRRARATGNHDIGWRLPLALWELFSLRGPWTDWGAVHRSAVESARLAGEPEGVAWTLSALAYTCQDQWLFQESAGHLRHARPLFRAAGERTGEAWALHGLGLAARRMRRYDKAVRLHRQALRITAQLGDTTGVAWALGGLGFSFAGGRRYNEALDHFERSLIFAREADRRAEGWTRYGLGHTYHRLRRLDRATARYVSALEIFREIGDWAGQAETLDNLARIQLWAGQREKARESWTTALDIFHTLRLPQETPVRGRLAKLDAEPDFLESDGADAAVPCP